MSENDTQIMTLSELAEGSDWAGRQQLKLAFDNSMLSMTANIFCAFVIVVLLWPISSSQGLIAWLGFICVSTVLWITLLQRFNSHRDQQVIDFPLWRNVFISGAFLSGCVWGTLSIFLFPQESILHQAYLTFILGGVCAGALTAFAPLPNAFSIFAVPVMLPYAYAVWSTGSPEATLMATLVAGFLIILMRTARLSRQNVEDVLALQVQNADLTRALHHRATHDSLCDLVNHGEFNRRLDRLAREERNEGSEYCLIFIDLDMFKEVNDNGGHAAGDKILQGVADILRQRIRASDTAARVGGDEFALLLQDCPHNRAREIAESIREDIANLKVEYENETYSVQASLGISYGDSGVHSSTSMLKAADAACYAAKEHGRNQVHVNKASDLFDTSARFDMTRNTI